MIGFCCRNVLARLPKKDCVIEEETQVMQDEEEDEMVRLNESV
jgi:hypothetical protein